MKDKEEASSLKHKGKKSIKDGDDEMTVVVPPSKASKQSSTPPTNDIDGDVNMDESENPEAAEVEIDPVTQAIR